MANLKNMDKWLRKAGLTVIEMPGWKKRANAIGRFAPVGIMLHHDGMGLGFNDNPHDDLNVPKNMSKPYSFGSQAWIKRTGEIVLVAAGKMPHAGTGSGKADIKANMGNELTVGLETDHYPGNPWTPEMLNSIRVFARVVSKKKKFKAKNYIGHKEYAPGRKADPEGLDMVFLRKQLAVDLRKFTPAKVDWVFTSGKQYGANGCRGFKNEANKKTTRRHIRWIQKRMYQLGYVSKTRYTTWKTIPSRNGRYRKHLVIAVRSWQYEHFPTRVTGYVGKRDWDLLDNKNTPGKGD